MIQKRTWMVHGSCSTFLGLSHCQMLNGSYKIHTNPWDKVEGRAQWGSFHENLDNIVITQAVVFLHHWHGCPLIFLGCCQWPQFPNFPGAFSTKLWSDFSTFLFIEWLVCCGLKLPWKQFLNCRTSLQIEYDDESYEVNLLYTSLANKVYQAHTFPH